MDIQYLHNIGVVSAGSSEPSPPPPPPPPPQRSTSPPHASASQSSGARPSSAAAGAQSLDAARATAAVTAETGGGRGLSLEVTSMPSQDVALTNFVYVSEKDAPRLSRDGHTDPRFVRLGRAGFSLKVHHCVQPGTIALNKLQRGFLGAKIGNCVAVSELEQPSKLRACCLSVSCLRGALNACAAEVLWAVSEQLEGHVMVEDQPFTVRFKETIPLLLTVLCEESGATCCPAMLCSSTNVELRHDPQTQTTLVNFPLHVEQAKEAPVRLQLIADGLGALTGEYRLFSIELLVNGFHCWRQWKGDGWLYSGQNGEWCLGSSRRFRELFRGEADTAVGPSDNVLRSGPNARDQQPHEVSWQVRVDGQWCEAPKDKVRFVALQHRQKGWAPKPVATGPGSPAERRSYFSQGPSSLLQGLQHGGHPPDLSSIFEPAAPTEEFVQSMRDQGMTNWVFHRGHAVNLEDPDDTAQLSADTLDRLIREACLSGCPQRLLPLQQQRPPLQQRPLVPLHPWEVEKLTSVASQVSCALRSGRYGKDFGEILLSQLGGWWGDEDWARAESQRIASLVEVDDAQSREQLLRWVDESLVQSLREITKEAQRGQLAGVMPTEEACGSSGSQQASAAPSEARASGRELEDLELQQALLASLEEDDCAWPESDGDSVDSGDEDEAKVEEVVVEAEGRGEGDGEGEAAPPCCSHRCDLGGSCCACIVRAPRPGVVPGLVSWWQGRGLAPPPLGPCGRELRFLCKACSDAGRVERGERWPLPFGGEVLLRSGARVEELVLPTNSEGDALDVNDANVSWEEGSWVAVEAAGGGEAASEASWVLP